MKDIKNIKRVGYIRKIVNGFLRNGLKDSNGLDQVLTPDHIDEIFTSLTNNGAGLYANNRVIYIYNMWNGVFLGSIINENAFISRKLERREQIRKFGVWVNERDPNLILLTILNNILHGDGKSNIKTKNGANYNFMEWILSKNAKLTHAFINPPYHKDKVIPSK